MKKFNYLFIVLFSFFLLSCSRDEDRADVPVVPQQLENVTGNWSLSEMRLKGNFVIGGVSTPIDMQVPLTSCEKKTKTTLLPNGTGIAEAWASTSGSCDKLREGTLTYTFDKDTRVLIVNMGTEVSRSIVRNLTSLQIVTEENVVNQDIGGITFTGTVYTTMVRF